MYKSKDRCTSIRDRITHDRETRCAKTYQKHSPQTSVHHEQQVELRKKVESGSTIADSGIAVAFLVCGFFCISLSQRLIMSEGNVILTFQIFSKGRAPPDKTNENEASDQVGTGV